MKRTTAEWLRKSRAINDDTGILRKLILDTFQIDVDNQQTDGALFEQTYKLGAIPKKKISKDIIGSALGVIQEDDDLLVPVSIKTPRGDTLASQIQSLLTNNITENERDTLTYTLSRIVTQRIPRKVRWPIITEGLDTLSAALLQLFNISEAINQKIPWIIAIWKWKIREAKIDALESIKKTILQNPDVDEIEYVLKEEDQKFKNTTNWNTNIDNPDPLSTSISSWVTNLLAAVEREKKGKVQKRPKGKRKGADDEETLEETLATLRRTVRELLAEIKGYSSALTYRSDVQSDPFTDWNLLALRADGPSSNEYDSLLRLLRKEFNILRNDSIRKLCINLAHNETPGHPTVEDLEQVSDFTGRNAYYEMQRLESLFNEQYILNLGKIGLRYRYIFTELQRSGVSSDGMVERLYFNEKHIRGCTIHIEPNLSEGPDRRLISGDYVEAVAEHEIVTFNLNHYDLNTGDWLTPKQGEKRGIKQKDNLLIQRSTITNDKRPFSLTTNQTEFLGLLWTLQGTHEQRKWLLDTVHYNQQTATRNLKVMLNNHVIRLVYLPALEFCRLPDGLVAYANCSDRKSRDRLVDHIVESQPFSRIHIGDTNDVVAHIRSPFKKSGSVAVVLKGKMQEFSDNYFTARMQERKTYKITSFHKLRQPKTGTWRDPW